MTDCFEGLTITPEYPLQETKYSKRLASPNFDRDVRATGLSCYRTMISCTWEYNYCSVTKRRIIDVCFIYELAFVVLL